MIIVLDFQVSLRFFRNLLQSSFAGFRTRSPALEIFLSCLFLQLADQIVIAFYQSEYKTDIRSVSSLNVNICDFAFQIILYLMNFLVPYSTLIRICILPPNQMFTKRALYSLGSHGTAYCGFFQTLMSVKIVSRQ